MSTLKRLRWSAARPTGASILKGGIGFTRKPYQYINYGPFYVHPKVIRYEEISNQNPGVPKTVWKPFSHYLREVHLPIFPTAYSTSEFTSDPLYYRDVFWADDPTIGWVDSNFGTVDNPTNGLLPLWQAPPYSVDQDFIPDVPNRAYLVGKLIESALPEIRPRLSILNSIFELKDAKSVVRTVRRVQGTFKTLRKEIPKFFDPRSTKRKTAMSILGSASDVYLQQQFNIRPLISDIKAISDSLKTVQRQVRKILDDAEKPLTIHRSMKLTTAYQNSFEKFGPHSYWNSLHYDIGRPGKLGAAYCYRDVNYEESSLRVTMQYSYHLSEFQRIHADTLGMLDALGIQANPAIIWNALPWSFVVDWVLGVSSWLNSLRKSNLRPVTVIRNFCWSQKIVRRITTSNNLVWGADKGFSKVSSVVRETSYKRGIKGMDVNAAIASSGLNSREFSLASALVLSRKRQAT